MVLDWQNNNSVRAAHFFVHFFAITAWQQRENAQFHVFLRMGMQQLSFSFPEPWYSTLEFDSKKIANVWQIKWDGIRAIKTESSTN